MDLRIINTVKLILTDHPFAESSGRVKDTKEQVMGNMHTETGETGAAHPLVMFVRALEDAKPGDKLLMAGFGQGCDALAFQVTDAIKDSHLTTNKNKGINSCLKNKRELNSYTKFARFRGLLQMNTGIREEMSGQTAMTTLYRNRKMILGLVGGKCTSCNTPQFPAMDICVNPECGEHHTMEDYEFADRTAKVVMYTGDMLAVSVDPPAIYGLVQFEDGGRILADFTDCTLDDVKIGGLVNMSFRKKWYDKEKGYTGYFWKALPQNTAQ